MSLQNQYNKFAIKIALNRQSDEYKKAREKDDLVTPKVIDALNKEGYEVIDDFLQGSLAYDTGVIPLDGDYDIDRAVAITYSSSPDNPVEPKKTVKKVLSDHGFADPKIKKPCVTAPYATEPLHIDFPVYRYLEWTDQYELAVGKEHSDENNRSWSYSEPKKFVDWMKSREPSKYHSATENISSVEKSQFYRLVRYIKRWRDFKYSSETARSKIYSISLSIMVRECFIPIVDENSKPDDNESLRLTLDQILTDYRYFSYTGSAYNVEVRLPVYPNSDTFKSNGIPVGSVLRNRLTKLRDCLSEVSEMDSEVDQCEKLRSFFGNDFPEGRESSEKCDRDKKKSPGLVGVSHGA